MTQIGQCQYHLCLLLVLSCYFDKWRELMVSGGSIVSCAVWGKPFSPFHQSWVNNNVCVSLCVWVIYISLYMCVCVCVIVCVCVCVCVCQLSLCVSCVCVIVCDTCVCVCIMCVKCWNTGTGRVPCGRGNHNVSCYNKGKEGKGLLRTCVVTPVYGSPNIVTMVIFSDGIGDDQWSVQVFQPAC